MEITDKNSLLHWNYFLALESDVERLSRFVEFTCNNFGAYSIEIAHLFLAAASEVDVIAKRLCPRMDGSTKAENIKQYRDVLRRTLPKMETSLVTIPRYGLELQPWGKWADNKTPDWWQAHNDIKHHRDKHFALANLKNVLDAMAGLFLLNLYYYRSITDGQRIQPPQNLFSPPPDLAFVCPSLSGRMGLVFTKNHV